MFVRAAVAGFLWLADHDPVPDRCAATACRLMQWGLRWYRRVGSAHSGRHCLFARSCSQRALDAFVENGWRDGLAQSARQLRRCGGDDTLLTSVHGEVVLIASDRQRFPAYELSMTVRQAVLGTAGSLG